MKLIFNIKTSDKIEIILKQGRLVLDAESLTINQGFDNMLINTLDKLLRETKIDRMRLKSAEIQGKIKEKALWGMILKTILKALVA